MANRKRNIQMKFYVTEDEKRLIDEKMSQLPTRRYGAYLRKMAILVCVCTLNIGLVARPGSTKWRVRHPPFLYGEIDERIEHFC